MDYYLMDVAGDLNDESLCLLEDAPEGMDAHDFCLVRGVPATPHFPEDAKCRLRPENPGIKRPGFLGNTKGFLIVCGNARSIIDDFRGDRQIEYFNFTLINQKGREHSTDYFFVNPIGGYDCLDEAACEIEYDDEGEAVVVGQFVLDAEKTEDAPHLFRIDKAPTKYVMSYDLLVALKGAGTTNMMGRKLEVQ